MAEKRKTFCRVCHAACPMVVEVEDDRRVVAVSGDRDDPLFEGYTCIKGRQLADQHHHPDRLRSSLRRTEHGFEPVSSADALDEIAARIDAIVDEHGPRAVASYTGTGAFQNSTSVPVTAAWHAGFGSPSFYTSITIDQPAHRSAALRLGAWEAGWHNFTDADVSLAVGYNPLVSSYGPAGGLQGTNPFVALRRAKDRGLKLIVDRPPPHRAGPIGRRLAPGAAGRGPDPAGRDDPPHPGQRSPRRGVLRPVTSTGSRRWPAAVEPFTLDYVAERARVDAADVVRARRAVRGRTRGARRHRHRAQHGARTRCSPST